MGGFLLLVGALCLASSGFVFGTEWAFFPGKGKPAPRKRIVILTGDEEYRSEESGPMLARILAERHGFDCTVLFALNPADGTIDPLVLNNIPGLEALDSADLCLLFLRFRELPDAQMKHFVDYLNAGKPLIGLRTATHAFLYKNRQSPYAKFSYNSTEWPGGFGQQVLGETWVDHHGKHGVESTRGIPNEPFRNHPTLKGVTDVWGPTDVYTVSHLGPDARILMWGQVLTGMKSTDPKLEGKKNDPMMPLVWTREYKGEKGKISKIFTTTMGAAVDFENEGLRRLLVNACYWALGLEKEIPAQSNVEPVGEFKPSYFGFGKFKKGIKPQELGFH
jgi:type 1 glutamine amidotransferase